MNIAYLSLGSNEGDRAAMLRQAIDALNHQPGSVVAVSHVYETAAWGVTDQPDFLNIAVALETSLYAPGLLQSIRAIEAGLGRQRHIRWGPRTIDIDILFFNNDIIDTPDLQLPHPRLQERRFVLQPLAGIAPALVHPVFGRTMSELLLLCPDELEVTDWGVLP